MTSSAATGERGGKMEFQNFVDPFGAALQYQGKQLSNDAQSISNATNLYKLGMAKEQYSAMLEDMAESHQGMAAMGGVRPPDPGAKGLPGTSVAGGSDIPLSSGQIFKEAQQLSAAAKKWQFLNPSLSERYASRSASLITNAVTARDREFKEQDKFMDSLADTAAMASQSPEDQGRALALLSHRLPAGISLDDILYKPPQQGGLGMKQGPNGQPIWDKAAWQSVGQFSKVGQEQMKMKHEEFLEGARLKGFDLQEAAARRADAAAARADAKLRDSEAAAEDKKELRGIKDSRAVVDKAQTSLERDPLYKNYDRYEQARGAVRFIENKLQQPGGYQNITAADIQQLRSHYNNIKEDFRTRAGGKYSEQDFAKLNGVLQSLDKWASTIGRGTPAASERTAKDAVAVINDEYATRTTNLVRDELKTAKNVEKRGGDPTNLRLKGDVKFLLQQGLAVVKPDTDDPQKKWISFKDDPSAVLPFYEEAF